MKIIGLGNKEHRVVFASDAITYTEPVQTYKALIKQRFRWRYGRMQSFWKNRKLFFSTSRKYSPLLTWFLLPTTLLYEFALILEPLVIALIVYIVLANGDPSTLMFAVLIFVSLLVMSIWASEHISRFDRLRLSLYAPVAYLLLYLMIVVEYITGIQSLGRIGAVPKSIRTRHTTWQSPERNPATKAA